MNTFGYYKNVKIGQLVRIFLKNSEAITVRLRFNKREYPLVKKYVIYT